MNTLFMAFATGKISTEAGENNFKKYVGVGNIKVLAVNPTKAQIKEYMGYEPNEEPVYHGVQEVDGKNIPYARVTFLIRTNAEKSNGIELTQQLTYFIRGQYRLGNQSGKYQVIDAYGNTAWATQQNIASKAKIQNAKKDGSGFVDASIIGDYRPAYVGEVALTNFLKEYLCIGKTPSVYTDKEGKRKINETNGFDWVDSERRFVPKTGNDLADCMCAFTEDEIKAMLKGDFEAVKSAVALQPKNEVKAVFGIRVNNSDGKEYQDIYPRVIRTKTNNVDVITLEIENSKDNNGLSNRYYEFTPLHEYKVEPTNLEETPVAENPFETSPWD